MLFYLFKELHQAAQGVAINNFIAENKDFDWQAARDFLLNDTSKIFNMFGQEKKEHLFLETQARRIV